MTDLIHNWVNQHRRLQNYLAAVRELRLSPQEAYAYRHHLANLDRGGVPNPDGTVSSFLNRVDEINGKTYLYPTVWDNKILDEDAAQERTIADGLDKWPTYNTPEEADARYMQMHRYMERDTDRKLHANPVKQPAGSNDTGKVAGPQPAGAQGKHRR